MHHFCRHRLLPSFLSLTLTSLGYVFLGLIEPSVLASFWFLMYLYVFSSVCPSAHLRAQSYAERLRLGLAVMHGEASQYDSEMVDGPQSPPLSRPATGHTGLELPCKTSRLLTSFFFFLSLLCLISDSHGYLSRHPSSPTDCLPPCSYIHTRLPSASVFSLCYFDLHLIVSPPPLRVSRLSSLRRLIPAVCLLLTLHTRQFIATDGLLSPEHTFLWSVETSEVLYNVLVFFKVLIVH